MKVRKWNHAEPGWILNHYFGVWMCEDRTFGFPAFCLGERMVHPDFGRDKFDLCWTGSTDDDWHGILFDNDLCAALKWVSEAKWPEVGAAAWSSEHTHPEVEA